MKILQKGDTCPCCGFPIETDDPDKLLLLSVMAHYNLFPSVDQVREPFGRIGDESRDWTI